MKVKEIVSAALFIALSFIGANIKIMGSIAFDSMPGFLGALLFGPAYGAFIGMTGHFLTALLSGFPLSFPVHMIIIVDMAATMAIFSLVYRKIAEEDFSLRAIIIASVFGVIMNGPVSLLMLSPLLLPAIGLAGMLALLPVVSGAAALNIVLACLVYKLLPDRIKKVRKKI